MIFLIIFDFLVEFFDANDAAPDFVKVIYGHTALHFFLDLGTEHQENPDQAQLGHEVCVRGRNPGDQ